MTKKLQVDFASSFSWDYATNTIMGIINVNPFKYHWIADTLLCPIVTEQKVLTTEKLRSSLEFSKSLFSYFDIKFYPTKDIKDLVNFIVRQIDKKKYVFLSISRDVLFEKKTSNNHCMQLLIYGYDYDRCKIIANKNFDMRILKENKDDLLRSAQYSINYCPFGNVDSVITVSPKKRAGTMISLYDSYQNCFKNEIRINNKFTTKSAYEYVGLYSIIDMLKCTLSNITSNDELIKFTHLIDSLYRYYCMLKELILSEFKNSLTLKNIDEAIKILIICKNILIKCSITQEDTYINKISVYLDKLFFQTNEVERYCIGTNINFYGE